MDPLVFGDPAWKRHFERTKHKYQVHMKSLKDARPTTKSILSIQRCQKHTRKRTLNLWNKSLQTTTAHTSPRWRVCFDSIERCRSRTYTTSSTKKAWTFDCQGTPTIITKRNVKKRWRSSTTKSHWYSKTSPKNPSSSLPMEMYTSQAYHHGTIFKWRETWSWSGSTSTWMTVTVKTRRSAPTT